MNRTQIDYFIAVAEYLNFTKAAQISYTSQPNISKQIALLEEELGFSLFHRNKHQVELTNAGGVLYQELKRISSMITEAIENAADASKNTEYQIRIGVASFLDTRLINDAIKAFNQKYTKSKVHIESVDFEMLRNKVAQQHYDIVFAVSYFLSGIDSLDFKPVSKHQMYLTGHNSHPLADKSNATIADFKDDLFFILEPSKTPSGSDLLVLELCKKYGFQPKTQVFNSLSTYFVNLELGKGVAFFDTSVRLPDEFVESFFFVIVPEKMAVNEVVAAWKEDNPNPAIPLFLQEFNSLNF